MSIYYVYYNIYKSCSPTLIYPPMGVILRTKKRSRFMESTLLLRIDVPFEICPMARPRLGKNGGFYSPSSKFIAEFGLFLRPLIPADFEICGLIAYIRPHFCDLDNQIKSICDAIQVARSSTKWNDRQICLVHAFQAKCNVLYLLRKEECNEVMRTIENFFLSPALMLLK